MATALVDAPLLEPARFGLVQAARDLGTTDERWTGGLAWEPESCSTVGTFDPCGDDDKTLDPDDNPGAQSFTPFGIWAGYRCSTIGADGEDFERRARNTLAVRQSAAVEAEFWAGARTQAAGWDNAYLRDADVTNLSPGSGSSPLVYALAALEEALADCGGRGMIHCTVQTAILWLSAQAVRRDGNRLLTALDTIVVPGAGYDGSAPDASIDATGETAYAYGTGLVDVRLSPVRVYGDESTIDHRTNTWEVRAERLAAATFDPCCHVGIRVDLCSTFCTPS